MGTAYPYCTKLIAYYFTTVVSHRINKYSHTRRANVLYKCTLCHWHYNYIYKCSRCLRVYCAHHYRKHTQWQNIYITCDTNQFDLYSADKLERNAFLIASHLKSSDIKISNYGKPNNGMVDIITKMIMAKNIKSIGAVLIRYKLQFLFK